MTPVQESGPYLVSVTTPNGATYARSDCGTGYIVRYRGGARWSCRSLEAAQKVTAPNVSVVAVATLPEAASVAARYVEAARAAMPADMTKQSSLGYTTPARWISQVAGYIADLEQEGVPADGFTIDWLPDGTTITVEQTTWEALCAAAGLGEHEAQCVARYAPLGVARQAEARILAAYNDATRGEGR